MSLRLAFEILRAGGVDKYLASLEKPIAEAATAAMRDTVDEAKVAGRAEIAGGGFGPKWQNALRGDTFPRGGKASASPAGLIYSKIGYSNIFEEGGEIVGKNKLWLPLSNVPVGVTASNYRDKVGEPLHTIKRPGKPPLLAARLRATDKRVQKGVSLSMLRRGAGIRVNKQGKVIRGQGTVRSVPLFVGIDLVRIAKRFNVRAAVARVVNERLGPNLARYLAQSTDGNG